MKEEEEYKNVDVKEDFINGKFIKSNSKANETKIIIII